MKQRLTRSIETLQEDDIINLLLYCLYRLTGDKDYAIISELIYSLDKDSLYKLCASFGGCTIKVPTLSELRLLIDAFIIYQKELVDGTSYKDACAELKYTSDSAARVLPVYKKVKGIIDEYFEMQ